MTVTDTREAQPTMSAAADTARAKLTTRELAALRAQLRRELTADLAAARAERRATRGEPETPEIAAAARRMVRAVGKRAGGDLEGLADLAALREVVDAELAGAVTQLRAGAQLTNGGYSWADVAQVLGITRQAAQQRFGR